MPLPSPENAFRPAVYKVTRAAAWILFPAAFGYRARGTEHVPQSGPAILAPNHTSYLDPPLVGFGIRRPSYYLAFNGLFQNRLFAAYISSLRAIPVNAEGGLGADVRAYKQALHILQKGHLLCIFPEGIRGDGKELAPLRPGVARLAMAGQCPLVPVRIDGAEKAWPRWQAFPRPMRRITVRFHRPLMPRDVEPADREKEQNRLMEQLKRRIAPPSTA